MIYITGDTHREFQRFSRKNREKLPFVLGKNDYVIVCGDFGLLWVNDKEFQYHLKWLSGLPFKILWVCGNHENYDMIAEYPPEEWNGGKVRHIVRDKIIMLERGQIFSIEGKTFFTFGGASTHDMPVLDKNAEDYQLQAYRLRRRKIKFRVLNENYWKQELPTEEEIQEARKNLKNAGYQVDYVITHCASNRMQRELQNQCKDVADKDYKEDILTDYFEELEENLQYKHWFFGHYHQDLQIDEKHTAVLKNFIPV